MEAEGVSKDEVGALGIEGSGGGKSVPAGYFGLKP